MLWLYLHFPQLQLDSLLRTSSTSSAVVIVDGQQHRICQLNALAEKSGIKLGMRLSSAILLCSDLSVVHYQAETERKRLHSLTQQLYQLVANISLIPPKGLLIAVSNMLKLYGDLSTLWREIQRWGTEQEVSIQASCAYEPLSAQLLAEADHGLISNDKAKLQQLLRQLSIAQLPISKTQTNKLQRMGIHTLGALQQLNLAELGKRFGPDILQLLSKLSGRHPEPQTFYQPPPGFNHHLDFLHEVYHFNGLRFPLNRLLQDFCLFLQKQQLQCEYLRIELHYRHAAVSQIDIRLAQAEDNLIQFRQLIDLHLAQLTLPEPTIAMSFSAPQLSPKQVQSTDLFQQQHHTSSPLQLINRLQAKCGNQHVSWLATHPDHRPEKNNYYHPAHLPRPLSSSATLLSERPTLLFTQPRPLTTEVILLNGPERIQTGWWDEDPVCRDYYLGVNSRQQRCWVFRDQQGKWFIHGLFA